MIGYKCLNKLNKFIKVHKDKNQHNKNNNVIYKVNYNTAMRRMLAKRRDNCRQELKDIAII